MSVAPYRTAAGKQRHAVFIGDSRANVYALDAQTGAQIWTTTIETHASAAITGAPIVYGGRMFIVLQGLGEEGRGAPMVIPAAPSAAAMTALDTSTGKVLWKTYTIDRPRHAPRERRACRCSVRPAVASGPRLRRCEARTRLCRHRQCLCGSRAARSPRSRDRLRPAHRRRPLAQTAAARRRTGP